MRNLILALAVLAVGCAPAPHTSPVPATLAQDVPALMRRSHVVAMDSEALRHVAELAKLPLPTRPVVIYEVQNALTFPCGDKLQLRCFGEYLGTNVQDEADVIFVTDHAPWLTMQHELLHYLTHDGRHGALFRQLNLGLD